MADRLNCTPESGLKHNISITANKIMDTCRDRDCMSDIRVYLSECSQELLDQAGSLRPKSIEIISTQISVTPVPFNKGYYQIDIKYFFRIICEVCVSIGRPQEVEGVATAEKKAILYGGEGSPLIFSSDPTGNPEFCQLPDYNEAYAARNIPKAVIECSDPILLRCGFLEAPANNNCNCCNCGCGCGCGNNCNCGCANNCNCGCGCPVSTNARTPIVDEFGHKKLFATIGLFSIIRIERPAQIIVAANEYTIPEKECTMTSTTGTDEDPCSLFNKMEFPTDIFTSAIPRPVASALGMNNDIRFNRE